MTKVSQLCFLAFLVTVSDIEVDIFSYNKK